MEDRWSGALEIVLKSGSPWGFSLKGGTESNSFLYISKICENGVAHVQGQLLEGDILIKINGVECYSKWEAVQLIRSAFQTLSLIVWRGSANPKRRDIARQSVEFERVKDKDFEHIESVCENGGVKLAKYHFGPKPFSEYNGQQHHPNHKHRNHDRHNNLNHKKSKSTPIQTPLQNQEGEEMEKVAFLNFLHLPSHHASHSVSFKRVDPGLFKENDNRGCKSTHLRPTSMLETGSFANSQDELREHILNSSAHTTPNNHFVKNGKRIVQAHANRASKRASRTAKLLSLGSSFSFSSSSKSNGGNNNDNRTGTAKFFGLKAGGEDTQNMSVTCKRYSPNKDVNMSCSRYHCTPSKGSNHRKSTDISAEFYENNSSWRHQVVGGLDMPLDHGHFRMLPEDSFRAFTPILEVERPPVSVIQSVNNQVDDALYETVQETENKADLYTTSPKSIEPIIDPEPSFYQTIKGLDTAKTIPQRPPLPNKTTLNTARNRSPLSANFDMAELLFSGSRSSSVVPQNGEIDKITASPVHKNISTEASHVPSMEFGQYFDGAISRETTSQPDKSLNQVTCQLNLELDSEPFLEQLAQESYASPTKSTSSCIWSPVSTFKLNNHAFKSAKSDSNLHYVIKSMPDPLDNDTGTNAFDFNRGKVNPCDANPSTYLPLGEGLEKDMTNQELEAMTRKYVKTSKFYSLQGLRKLGMGSKTLRATGNSIKNNRILGALYEKSAKAQGEECNSISPSKSAGNLDKPMNMKETSMSVTSLNNIIAMACQFGGKHGDVSHNTNTAQSPNSKLASGNILASSYKALTCSKSTSKIFNAKKRGAFLPSLSSIFKPLTSQNVNAKSEIDGAVHLSEIENSLDDEVDRDLAASVGKYEESNVKARGRSTWTEKYRKIWLDEEYERMKTNKGCPVNNIDGHHPPLLRATSEHPSEWLNKIQPNIRMGVACYKYKSSESMDPLKINAQENMTLSPFNNLDTPLLNQPRSSTIDNFKDQEANAGPSLNCNSKSDDILNSAIPTKLNKTESKLFHNVQDTDYHLYENINPLFVRKKCNEEDKNDERCFDSILTSLDNILNAQMMEKNIHNQPIPVKTNGENKTDAIARPMELIADGGKVLKDEPSHISDHRSVMPSLDECGATTTQGPPEANVTVPGEDCVLRKTVSPPNAIAAKAEESIDDIKTPPDLMPKPGPSMANRQRYSSYLQDTTSDWDDEFNAKNTGHDATSNNDKTFSHNRSATLIKATTGGGTVSFPILKMATISEIHGGQGLVENSLNRGGSYAGNESDSNILDLLSGMMRRKHHRQYAQSILNGQGKLFAPDPVSKAHEQSNESKQSANEPHLHTDRLTKKKRESLNFEVRPVSQENVKSNSTSFATNYSPSKSATLDSSSPNVKTSNYYFPHIDVLNEGQFITSSDKLTSPLKLTPKPKINSTTQTPQDRMDRQPSQESSALYVKSYSNKETGGATVVRNRYHRYYSNNHNGSTEEKITPIAPNKVGGTCNKQQTSPSTNPDPIKAPSSRPASKGPPPPSAPPSRSDSGYCSWDNGYASLPMPTPTISNTEATFTEPQMPPFVRELSPHHEPNKAITGPVAGSSDETELDEESFGYCEDTRSVMDDYCNGGSLNRRRPDSRSHKYHDGRTTVLDQSSSASITDNNSSIGSDRPPSSYSPEQEDEFDPVYVNHYDISPITNYVYNGATCPSQNIEGSNDRGMRPPRLLPRLRQSRPDLIPRNTGETILPLNPTRQSALNASHISDQPDSPFSPVSNNPLQHHHVRQKSQEEKDFERLSQEFSKLTTDPRILEVLVDPLSEWMDEAIVKLYALFGMSCHQNALDNHKQNEGKIFFSNKSSKTSFDVRFKREQLVASVNRKMEALKSQQTIIEKEIQTDEIKWQLVMADISNVAKPNEIERITQYFEDLEKIICLLLSLSLRITKTSQKLDNLTSLKPSPDNDKESLQVKKEKLILQYSEAIKLKESIDRRGLNINTYFKNYTPQFGSDVFHVYSKSRSKLIIDKRHVIEKVKLGEEQIYALDSST